MAELTFKTELFKAVGSALVANLAGLKRNVVDMLSYIQQDVNNANYEGFFGFDDYAQPPTYTPGQNFTKLENFLRSFKLVAYDGNTSHASTTVTGRLFKSDYFDVNALQGSYMELCKAIAPVFGYLASLTSYGFAVTYPVSLCLTLVKEVRAKYYFRLRQLITKVNDDPAHDTTALYNEFPKDSQFPSMHYNPFEDSGDYPSSSAFPSRNNTFRLLAVVPDMDCYDKDDNITTTTGAILMSTFGFGHTNLTMNAPDDSVDILSTYGDPSFGGSLLFHWLNSVYRKRNDWATQTEEEDGTILPTNYPPYPYLASICLSQGTLLLKNICCTPYRYRTVRLDDFTPLGGDWDLPAWTTILSANEFGYDRTTYNSNYSVFDGENAYKFDKLTGAYRIYNYDDNNKRHFQGMSWYTYQGLLQIATSTALKPSNPSVLPCYIGINAYSTNQQDLSKLGTFSGVVANTKTMVLPVHHLLGLHLAKTANLNPDYLCGVTLEDAY